MNDAATFELKIITPAEILVDTHVPTVVIPGTEGDFGVLPGHCNLFSMIRPGAIEVTMGDGLHRRFFVANGYADVTATRCTILSDNIHDLGRIEQHEIDGKLVAAREAMEAAENEFERGLAQKQLHAAETLAQMATNRAA